MSTLTCSSSGSFRKVGSAVANRRESPQGSECRRQRTITGNSRQHPALPPSLMPPCHCNLVDREAHIFDCGHAKLAYVRVEDEVCCIRSCIRMFAEGPRGGHRPRCFKRNRRPE